MYVTLMVLLLLGAGSGPQAGSPPTLKSVLLAQLKSTHNVQDWFVPASKSVEGLTAEQAAWKDGKGNHSIAGLVNHLIFWNQTQLAKFKGETPPAYSGNNDETFAANLDKAGWEAAVKRLDTVMTDLEKAIETADEKKLHSWYDTVAHISAHNAYHTGQIIYIRRLQGSWDPEKGVKG